MTYWIGKRLALLRVNLGFTQEDAAGVVGRSQSWMVGVEKGKADPGFHQVEKLLIHYNSSLAEVIKAPGAITDLTIRFEPIPPEQPPASPAPEPPVVPPGKDRRPKR